MFLGGVTKSIGDNHYWINGRRGDEKKDTPVIGLHRPYFSKEQYAELNATEAKAAYKKLEKLVRNYLNEIDATQALIDRMFKSASNEIDLVKDSEFREMFNKEEPFYSEWILAKCGASSSGEGLLSKDDADYMESVRNERWKEVKRLMKIHGGDLWDYNHIFPDGYSKERYDKLLSIVRSHNTKYHFCRKNVVKNHQIEFFSK